MSLWFHTAAAGRLLSRRTGPVIRMILVALFGSLWCVIGAVWTIATWRSIQDQARSIQVDVFLRPTASDRDARTLDRAIAQLPSVDHVRLIREQEVWREFSGDVDVDDDLRAVVAMPRIVRFWPRAERASVAELDATSAHLERAFADRVEQVVWSRELAEVVESRRRDLLVLAGVAGSLSVVLFLLALVYAFRAEIHVAGGDLRVGTLLGARAGWIAMPHLIVSAVSGAIGLLLALAIIAGSAPMVLDQVPWVGVVRMQEIGIIVGALAVPGFLVCWWQSWAAGRAAVRRGSTV